MLSPTPDQIRRIFLSPRPHLALMTAADLLGTTLKDLKKDIDEGVIVAISTGVGVRITREEMIAAAMRLWEQTVIEDALGDEAAAVLPERRSGWSSCASASRATSATCWSRSRSGMGRRSMRS